MALVLGLGAATAQAQDPRQSFVEANLLGIFYHELGHALIDVLQLPVFGQEEDAADVASVILITSIFDAETVTDMAYDTSLGFWGEALNAEDAGHGVAWWDVHGPDEQRFFNNVCLFYGADPDAREDFAQDMGLPVDRADGCEEEFDLAYDSWGAVLDDVSGTGDTLELGRAEGGWDSSLTARIIAAEVQALNDSIALPETLSIHVETCGEANAWFDPDAREIVMCLEFAPHLETLFDLVNAEG